MHDSIIIKCAREHNVMKSTLFMYLQLYEICRMICNKKRPPKGVYYLTVIYLSSSGSPANDVSKERIPANSEAEATATQLTSSSTAVVPIVAIAV